MCLQQSLGREARKSGRVPKTLGFSVCYTAEMSWLLAFRSWTSGGRLGYLEMRGGSSPSSEVKMVSR